VAPAKSASWRRSGDSSDGGTADKPYILFVGTVQPRKNLVRLIKAFSLITNDQLTNLHLGGGRCSSASWRIHSATVRGDSSHQPPITLLIAGKLGWMYEEILAAPKRFGVEKRVKFLGYVSEKKLAGLYSGALFFILPSLCEGFGLPVLEAMRFGCPVIASKAGALPEVVGDAGLLVDPYRVEEIAAAMKLMLENPELREALREKGYQRVRQFSWQKTAKETLKVFEKVYNSPS